MLDPIVRPLIFRENKRIFRAYLAEEYDGIGQYVNLALSRNSVTSGLRARIASGDFATGAHYPKGSEVLVFSDHGQLEVLTLGANPQAERRQILLSDDPTNEILNHFIIDNFENRVLTNAFGTPSRGTPDWVDLGGSVAGSPGSSQSIAVAALGGSGGWGRFLLQLSGTPYNQFPFQNSAGHGLYIPLNEIDDLDEFRIEFDMVVAPAVGFQGIAYAQFIIGGETPRIGIDLPFQFEHYTGVGNDHLDFFLARDNGGGDLNTKNDIISWVSSFDGHITIDRSVSRGSTIVTVGALGVFAFSPISHAGTNMLKRMYVFYSDYVQSPNVVKSSTLSIDNIELTNRP